MAKSVFYFGDEVHWALGDGTVIKCRILDGDKKQSKKIAFATEFRIETLEECSKHGIIKGKVFIGITRQRLSLI